MKSILTRAFKTFLQAFLAVLTAAGVAGYDYVTIKAAVVAGIAALLSFIQNVLAESEVKQVQVLAEKSYRSRNTPQ